MYKIYDILRILALFQIFKIPLLSTLKKGPLKFLNLFGQLLCGSVYELLGRERGGISLCCKVTLKCYFSNMKKIIRFLKVSGFRFSFQIWKKSTFKFSYEICSVKSPAHVLFIVYVRYAGRGLG
jgi:hypothetical protein